MNLRPQTLIAALLFLAGARAAFAQVTTSWTGADFANNTNFSNSANWGNGAPTGSDTANFGTTSVNSVTITSGSAAGSVTFTGSGSGSGYTFTGANTLTLGSGLSIASSVTQGISFGNSTVALAGTASFTNSSTTAALTLPALDLASHTLTLTTTNSGGSITVNGRVGPTGALVIGGTGVVFLTATNNDYAGGTTINSGTLQIGDAGGTSAGSLPGAVTNNGTLQFKPISGSVTVSGAVTGTGGVNLLSGSTQTVTLSGANQYSGATNVSGGTLADGAAGGFSPNSGIFMLGGASSQLAVHNNETIKGLGGVGSSAGSTVTVDSATTLTVSTNNLTYNGALTGNGGLTISGTSNQTLNGTGNDYTGVTRLSQTGGGQLQLNVASLANIGVSSSIGKGDATSASTNAASLVLDGGAALAYIGSSNISTDRLFTIGSGGGKFFVGSTGNLTFTNTGAVAYSTTGSTSLVLGGSGTTTNTFAPVLGDTTSGSVALFKSGPNSGSSPTWVLTGANTYTGPTVINNGVLQIGADNTLPITTRVRMVDNGPNFNAGAPATLDVQHNQQIASFDNNGNNYGNGASVILATNKTLTIASTSATGSEFDGAISGHGHLTFNGTGNIVSGSTLHLSGNNTYDGNTTIGGGALELNGTNTSPITVNGGTLVGDRGSTTGTLTFNSGGGLAIVTNFAAGATTFHQGSSYFWGLASAAGTAGTDWGQLTTNGTLTFDSSGQVTLMIASFSSGGANPSQGPATFDSTQSYSWDIITGASSITNFNAGNFLLDTTHFSNSFNGTFSVSSTANALRLNYAGAPIPEPTTAAMLAGLGALLAVIWRRKNARVRKPA